jgi:hypothetical protein
MMPSLPSRLLQGEWPLQGKTIAVALFLMRPTEYLLEEGKGCVLFCFSFVPPVLLLMGTLQEPCHLGHSEAKSAVLDELMEDSSIQRICNFSSRKHLDCSLNSSLQTARHIPNV